MKNNIKKFQRDFENGLDKLSNNHDVFALQSQIWSICNFYKVNLKFVSQIIIKKLLNLSKKKTILLPAFSNDLPKKKKYDSVKSLPNTGYLPLVALQSKKFSRSNSPMHSFLVIGKKTKEVLSLKEKTTWGKGSVYEWLENKKALWISLNLDWSEGCAFHHRSEELASVPYREFINFKGKLYRNGKFKKNIVEKKYSYSLDCSPKFNWNIWKKVFKKGDTKNIKINKSLVFRSALTTTITKRCVNFYKKNPYGSISNKKKIMNWVEKNK